MKGTIKHLNRAKSFGFIIGEDGKNYFFHTSALLGLVFDQLREKMPVVFDPATTEKGLRAEGVRYSGD